MIDSHCHLHLCKGETQTILQNAKDHGVSQLIQVATNLDTYDWGYKYLQENETPISLYLSAGLYPSEAQENWREKFSSIQSRFKDQPLPVAVGECGLDHYWDVSFNDEQEAMFRAQIEWAIEIDRPLIIHCRNAYEDFKRVIDSYGDEEKLRGVWHCFDGSLEEALSVIEKGFVVSLSGIVTYKNAKELQAVAKDLPKESVLIETDSPYLSPVPKRGEKNQPAFVSYVFKYLCELWSLAPGELETQLDQNTKRLFNLP